MGVVNDAVQYGVAERWIGNHEMTRTHRENTERIRIIRRLDFTKANRMTATYEEHANVLAAIQRRRSDEAQRLLKAHIEISKLEVRQITLDTLQRNHSPIARRN